MRAALRAASRRRLMQRRRDKSTIAVGISGGVDSATTALLLKAEGHDVVGVHMRNWDALEEGVAECMEQEVRDARRVCAQLGIGFQEVSFVREYWHNIFEPLLDGYSAGGTPNPDVACNRHIKFDHFLEHALALGADCVATGHYARLAHDPADGTTRLLKGSDAWKDQSYFLATVRQEGLRRARFPIGHLHKPAVREIAKEAGLHISQKRDSTGICFIGRRDFGSFLEGYLPQESGNFVCIDSGRTVGTHKGYALYTPGQRARVGGQASRWYVVGKDVPSNTVWVGEASDHPALFAHGLTTMPMQWIAGAPPPSLLLPGGAEEAAARAGATMRCHARIRHPGELLPCTVELIPAESADGAADASGSTMAAAASTPTPGVHGAAVRVRFDEPVRAVAPLQTLVLYDGDVCLGGAPVHSAGPSLWEERGAVWPSASASTM